MPTTRRNIGCLTDGSTGAFHEAIRRKDHDPTFKGSPARKDGLDTGTAGAMQARPIPAAVRARLAILGGSQALGLQCIFVEGRSSMEHESHIILDGASNVRDLCWTCRAGPPSGARRVLRSANLDRLSQHGRLALGELGIAVVIDLRGKEEAGSAPQFDGTTRVHLPIEPTVVAELLDLLAVGRLSPPAAVSVMERTYRHYIGEHAAVFGGVLHHVLEADRRPVLFHCAAGKDRTGVAAALILTALGVAPEVIMEDYLLSNRLYRPLAAGSHNIPDDVREAILKVRSSYLEAAFAAMTDGWGGPDEYLRQALGFGLREREALRLVMR
jgi:protein-tyrosine phosphatase